jgi:hypothetical protein
VYSFFWNNQSIFSTEALVFRALVFGGCTFELNNNCMCCIRPYANLINYGVIYLLYRWYHPEDPCWNSMATSLLPISSKIRLGHFRSSLPAHYSLKGIRLLLEGSIVFPSLVCFVLLRHRNAISVIARWWCDEMRWDRNPLALPVQHPTDWANTPPLYI